MPQPHLFPNPVQPKRQESLKESRRTRNEANATHKPKKHPQTLKVLAAIVEAGSAGLTRHEAAAILSLPVSSVCGRVKPLLDSGELFQKPGVRREGRAVLFARGAV